MFKVTGIAQIHDYQRMGVFLERFNGLGEAIAYAFLQSPQMTESLASMKAALGTASQKDRQKLHEELKKLG